MSVTRPTLIFLPAGGAAGVDSAGADAEEVVSLSSPQPVMATALSASHYCIRISIRWNGEVMSLEPI